MLNPTLRLLPGWGVQISSSMEYLIFEDPNQKQFNKRYWQPDIWLSGWYCYKRFSFNLNGIPLKIRIPTLTGYSSYTGDSQLQVSYRLNNNWSVNGSARYLFMPLKYEGVTRTDGYSEVHHTTSTDRYWRFMIGMNYNFRKGKQKGYMQKRSKTYEDEVNLGKKVY